MKTSDFKKIVKESVKEAIKEELKEILLEALKSSKTIVKENLQSKPSSTDYLTQRKAYTDILNSMSSNITEDTLNFNTDSMPFQPNPINTSAEGSSLPPGEVSLNQIMKMTNGI